MEWESYKENTLEEGRVHIWRISIKAQEKHLKKYWNSLQESEKEQANKFKFIKDHNCYVVARGVLRELLGRYVNVPSTDIHFDYSKYGKPYFDHSNQIKFNVSHSGDTIIIGFTKKNELGVDVEEIKSNIEYEPISKSFFSGEEVKQLMNLPQQERALGFYNCWTRKEAFIKAEGSGLSFPLNQFVVSLDSKDKAALLLTKWDAEEASKWTLETFVPYENYISALAVKRKIEKLRFYNY